MTSCPVESEARRTANLGLGQPAHVDPRLNPRLAALGPTFGRRVRQLREIDPERDVVAVEFDPLQPEGLEGWCSAVERGDLLRVVEEVSPIHQSSTGRRTFGCSAAPGTR